MYTAREGTDGWWIVSGPTRTFKVATAKAAGDMCKLFNSEFVGQLTEDFRHSNSALDLYRSCPLKFSYHYVHRLESRVAVSAHDLEYGKAMHDALAVLYSPAGTVKKAQEAFAASYPENEYPSELPAWSQGKSFKAGIATIAAYARRWVDDDQFWDVLEIEALEDTSAESETTRVVRLDLIVRDKRDGEIYGVDHKVTGKYLHDYWKQFEPHSQIRSYADHIKKKYGHCGGFYINALSLRHRGRAYTPRKGPNKGEQLPAGDWQDFGRICFNPNEECLQLERQNIAYWVHRIEQDITLGMFGYNTQECHRSGVECEYWKICSAGWTWPVDEPLIEQHYRRVCGELMDDGDRRCQLDARHEGKHNSERVRMKATDFEVAEDEEVEDAEV